MAHHHLGEAEEGAAAFERGVSAIDAPGADASPELAAMDRALQLEARALLGRD